MTRDTHHFGVDGEIFDVDSILCSDAQWDASPESRDPDWSVVRSGDRVRATAAHAAPGHAGHRLAV